MLENIRRLKIAGGLLVGRECQGGREREVDGWMDGWMETYQLSWWRTLKIKVKNFAKLAKEVCNCLKTHEGTVCLIHYCVLSFQQALTWWMVTNYLLSEWMKVPSQYLSHFPMVTLWKVCCYSLEPFLECVLMCMCVYYGGGSCTKARKVFCCCCSTMKYWSIWFIVWHRDNFNSRKYDRVIWL